MKKYYLGYSPLNTEISHSNLYRARDVNMFSPSAAAVMQDEEAPSCEKLEGAAGKQGQEQRQDH